MMTNLRKGVLEPCLLALLWDGELYGVELAKQLHSAGLIASEGTLYPVLARLRKAGFVVTRWEESPSGAARRYYALTDVGRDMVTRFAGAWEPFANSVNAVLVRGGRHG